MPFKNKRKYRKYQKEYRNKNKDKQRIYMKKYYKEKILPHIEERNKRARIRAREWAIKHPIKYKRNKRKSNLKIKYGLTVEQYRNLLNIQKDRCAICNNRFKKQVCVDHNHKTNKIRGLLCHKCNLILGYVESKRQDTTLLIDSFKKYLNGNLNIKEMNGKNRR